MTAGAASAPAHVELARAKINLTLEVLGRRADGFHELESLVAFADIGDRLTFEPHDAREAASRSDVGQRFRVELSGPFADAIHGENLVDRAVALACAEAAALDAATGWTGRIRLEKQLPVASGIGGGSADAAAALRALRSAYPEVADRLDWPALAARIGADVPVCLLDRSALMRGIGDRIEPLHVPAFAAVLANPLAPVPADKTRRVFAALGAPALQAPPEPSVAPRLQRLDDLLALLRRVGNGLEAAACAVVPSIAVAKAALAATDGCLHAFLSGAGPTCVGIYPDPEHAGAAAAAVVAAQPGWWVRATAIGH